MPQSPPRTHLPRFAKFAIAMLGCTAACTALWQLCVTDVLYHCTDSLWLDYLQGPSGWVHGTPAGQPGDFGDTIRPGWSIDRLKALWFSLLAGSVIVSLILSRIHWSIPPHNLLAAGLAQRVQQHRPRNPAESKGTRIEKDGSFH